ncbi:hypothetical protein IP81_07480 [Novosphingobium sp. AAP83]|uniref:hypothetical protein n=1 Tax=Novosphingobium sp. AAP83 TaxID=1523425 RepID=UPI0006B97EA0|nr:hypothetical protein [Novosphingobium sp. AAP83]KPF91898.1 hypothetical protein IP81_07480 [Novosphingobium sp. AAP83]
MARPKNEARFKVLANAEWEWRQKFDKLNQAILDWDNGGQPFSVVSEAIAELERDFEEVPEWDSGMGDAKGAAYMGHLASRLKGLSAAQAALFRINGDLAARKEAVRDELIIAAAGIRSEPNSIPHYMVQLVLAMLAVGMKQHDVRVPSRNLASKLLDIIRSYRSKSEGEPQKVSIEQALIDQVAPTQSQLPQEQPLRRHTLVAPLTKEERMQLWSDLPRKYTDLEWIEVPITFHHQYPLPPFKSIEEFTVAGDYPRLIAGRKDTINAFQKHLFDFRSHWEPELTESCSKIWAVLLSRHLRADSFDVQDYMLFFMVQSPWNEDRALHLKQHSLPE